MNKIVKILLIMLALFIVATPAEARRKHTKKKHSTVQTTQKLTPVERIVVGKHMLSLQWISWDYFGTCEIKKIGDNLYSCKGQQLSKEYPEDYLKINGTIIIQDADNLIFEGVIAAKVYHLNNGEEFTWNGPQNFVRTGKRRYWRLQAMTNADVCNYVDIYLKR